MNRDEVSKRYHIPLKILQDYERWGLGGAVKTGMGAWQYDDEDLERLSLVMTLYDIGFSPADVEQYMRLLVSDDDTEAERLRMITGLRQQAIEDIRVREKRLDRIDYVRYQLQHGK